jgi:dTDP-glucose 4,6-dehydratase
MSKQTKYLVTGGCGFIGSHYIKNLFINESNIRVANIDCLTYAGRLENLHSIRTNPNYVFYKANVKDKNAIEQIYQAEKPDIVVHFAAFSHVDRSILDAAEFIETNIGGTFNMLEAARKFGVGRHITIGTDEVYGQIAHPNSSVETDPLDPRSPYSASKASSDLLTLSYYSTFKVPAMVSRCSNNYGGYQLPEKLIPLFVTNLIDNEKVPVYGRGDQIREWIHVEDHNNAVDYILRQGQDGQIYNIGSGEERTNLEITELILGALGKGQDSIRYVEDRKGHDKRYSIDCSKLRNMGWKPVRQFKEAMQDTVDWYVSHENWWRPIKQELKDFYKQQYKG